MKAKHLYTVYQYVKACREDVRISVKKFHRQHSSYRAICSTSDILKEARASQILIGPFIYTRTGLEVELIKESENGWDVS